MDMMPQIKKTLIMVAQALKDQEPYCPHLECLVQYFEHYHIDEHTVTFIKPEGTNETV
jgi:hypothetical protein